MSVLSTREDARPLAAFRVAVGLCVCLSIGSVIGADLVGPLWTHADHGGIQAVPGTALAQLLGGPTPAVMHTLAWLAMLGGVALVAGIGGRVTALFTLQVFLACVDTNGAARGGYDLLLANALWLLVLGGGTATWSTDARLRTGHWSDASATAGAWVRWLVLFQLLLMYWTTGLQKLSIHWIPGGDLGALYWILQQPTWQRFDMAWVGPLFPLTQIATLVTWLWEISMPLWAWALIRRERGQEGQLERLRIVEVYTVVGIGLHLVITVLLEVGPFSWVSLAYYTALWPALRRRRDVVRRREPARGAS